MKIEAETNGFLAELASFLKPEDALRHARTNLVTKAIRQATTAKVYDKKTFLKAGWQEGSGIGAEMSG